KTGTQEQDQHKIPPRSLEPGELTQDERDHIDRIARMALESETQQGILMRLRDTAGQEAASEGKLVSTEPRSLSEEHPATTAYEKESQKSPIPSSIFSTKQFSGFGFKSFKNVMTKAGEAGNALGNALRKGSLKMELEQTTAAEAHGDAQVPLSGERSRGGSLSRASEASAYSEGKEDVTNLEGSSFEGNRNSEERTPSSSTSSLFNLNSFAAFSVKALKDVIHNTGETRATLEESTAGMPIGDDRRTSSSSQALQSTIEKHEELTKEELDHNNRIAQMAIEEESRSAIRPQPPLAAAGSAELTQEELDHVNRMAQMAAEEDAMSEIPHSAPKDEPDELTQEELDHIESISRMAMEEEALQAPPLSAISGRDEHISRDSPFGGKVTQTTRQPTAPLFGKSLTGFGLKAFKGAMQKADEARAALEDLTTTKHIENVRRSSKDVQQAAYVGEAPEQDVLSYPFDKRVELAQEALEAAQTAEESNDLRESQEFAEGELRFPGRREEHHEEQLSPTSSTGSRQGALSEHVSRKSSGFDIRSIPEIINTPNLSKWYEEQLSFMKESIADDEEEEELAEHDDRESPREEEEAIRDRTGEDKILQDSPESVII
ncbi:unnamed protein product, partial [Heligmosomoides polygyrus]|uniref:Cyclic nucleotide-binding domain-containing protein n=1 Tax=Heligmosomoides polygyrus TaxID=6339 RepID=A0A183F6Z8_HELPZ